MQRQSVMPKALKNARQHMHPTLLQEKICMHMIMRANEYGMIVFSEHEATHFTRLQSFEDLKLGRGTSSSKSLELTVRLNQ